MSTYSRLRTLRSLFNGYKPLLNLFKRHVHHQEHYSKIFPPSLKRRPGYLTNEGWIMSTIPLSAMMYHLYFEMKVHKYEETLMDISHRSVDEPVSLPLDNPEEVGELEYRKSIVKGRFDHANEMYISDKLLKTPFHVIPKRYVKKYNPYFYSEPDLNGYHVITPFILESGEKILVNRGWVDESHVDPKTRSSGQVDGTVQITGLIRTNEKKSLLSYITGDKRKDNVWTRRDIDGMADRVNALPIMIELVKDSYVKGGPVAGQTLLDSMMPLDQMQWYFGWSAVVFVFTAFIWFNKYVRLMKLGQNNRF